MSEHVQIGDIRPRVQYAADGSQTTFPYPFPIFTADDLHVYLDESQATSGFSVSGVAASEGGAVTFTTPPGDGVRVTLLRQIDIQRVTDFQAGGPLRAATLNDALDYMTAVDQQLNDAVQRAVRLAPGAAETADLTLPSPEAGAVLSWNETASGLVNTFPEGTTTLSYATAAQGALADSAVQPNDIGTLAAQNANAVTITGGSIANTAINGLTLPSVTGANGQVLTSDGSGGMDWSTPVSGGAILSSDITDGTTTGRAVLTGDALAGRTALGLGAAATADTTDYATAAQGALADSAVQPGDIGTLAAQNANAVTITGGSIASTAINGLTLPSVTGANGQVLTSDGSGGMDWSTPVSGGAILSSDITDGTITGRAVLTGDALAGRTALGLGAAATADTTDYATAAQGALADSAVQPDSDVTLGTVDYAAARFKATATSVGAAHTVDLAEGKHQTLSMSANTVVTLPDPPTGRGYSIALKLIQDATGGRTPTVQQADATPTRWVGGAAPAWQTEPGQSDLVTLTHDGTDLIAEHVNFTASLGTPEPSAVSVIGIAQVSTGGGAGTWQRVDVGGNDLTGTAYDLSGTAFNEHAIWGGIADETVDGQAMVKIPAFYYKVGTAPVGSDQAGKTCWWIGDGPFEGATLHPAFRADGSDISHVWIGKYQGTNDGGTKLGSAAGVGPLTAIPFSTMQSFAIARNTGGVTGFMLWSMYQLAAIQMLALIEMGGSDSQALIGTGRVSAGSAASVDAADVAQATYRGLVGLWGNIWQMVDGLKTNTSNQIQIWDRDGNKTWVNTSTTAAATGWTVSVLNISDVTFDFRDIFAPASADGTQGNATFSDYHTGNGAGSEYVAYHGGTWTGGVGAGLFSSYLYHVASLASATIGGRLAKLP